MSVSEFREWAEREPAFITDLVARIEAAKPSSPQVWVSLTHSPDKD